MTSETNEASALIAVVNDDSDFLEMMSTLLIDEGYRTVTAYSSKDAHDVIRRERPDLVILDIRMEQPASGWNLLDLVRLDPATTDLPVLVCSADALFLRAKADLLRAQRCEALEKPFDLDVLLERVRGMLAAADPR
ncbi:MAG TPA: response regulator [Thermomicrobiaceae bacterium]|nr:response regulator [Thermomicrobiaceae bacterium]